ncbi:MAG: polysaccharide deacetylase family protein [Candidatus Woesearchaeota archaeon]|nr:MAG: polysaccharide deacetylase family protein [Candidatus Woesearchaeota archaeon]
MEIQISKPKLLMYWDYELQKAADVSLINKKAWDGYMEYDQTEKILSLLRKFRIKNTFAILGYGAEKGELPYHSPKQIKKIAKLGHEIASHSYNHEYLPDISCNQLISTLEKSKKILEKVTGKKVISFVPPYNMPTEYFRFPLALKPRKFSLSRLNVNNLLRALKDTGYKTCRINKFTPITNKIFHKFLSYKPIKDDGIMQFYLNCSAGFTSEAKQVVSHAIKNNCVAVVYGHPHSTGLKNKQNIKFLESFLYHVKDLEDEGLIDITTPSELYNELHKPLNKEIKSKTQ